MNTMTRRNFLRATAMGAAAGGLDRLADAAEGGAKRPHIVFLLADQWRASAMGYAGDPNVRTPHLDALAKESVNFQNAVSVCPVCTPYRASLLTGRYPTTTGMFLNDIYLPDRELCIAEVFKAAGYDTAYIGKWHVDGHGRLAYIPPERRQGWDYWKAAECDHDYNRSHYYTGRSDAKQFWEGYDAFAQTKDACGQIRSRAGARRPFLLLVSYGTPHFPHGTAPDDYKAMYPPEQIKLPPNVPAAMQNDRVRLEAQGYYAHCTALDQCVGEIVAALAGAGMAENTILVFTSDHGEMMGSHGVRPTTKQVPLDESARVPFLLRFPAAHGRAGRVVRMPLTTPDISATLAGLAGVPIPKTFEGRSLAALIRGGKEAGDRAALYMGVAPWGAGGEFLRAYRAIRTRRYTYVCDLKGPWLLFDDEKDPFQMNNLAGKAGCAALQKELDGRLRAELKRIGDDFRPARHYVEKFGYELAPHGSVSYAAGAKVQSPRPPAATP